jgi:hypothetical protein
MTIQHERNKPAPPFFRDAELDRLHVTHVFASSCKSVGVLGAIAEQMGLISLEIKAGSTGWSRDLASPTPQGGEQNSDEPAG